MSDLVNAFGWLFQNIHAFGWITLIILAWKASGRFEKFTSGISKSEEIINKVATNHLPHLQEGIDNVNDNVKGVQTELASLITELKGIRSDLLQYALRKD